VTPDSARDAEYTRACGRAVAAAFKRNTVVMSTSFVAFVMFRYLQGLYPDLDLYRLLRVSKSELIPFDALYHRADALRTHLRDMAARNEIQLASDVADLSIPDLVERGAEILRMYHTTPVVEMRTNGLEVSHPNLLFYYGNRLVGYGLEKVLGELTETRSSADVEALATGGTAMRHTDVTPSTDDSSETASPTGVTP